MNDDEFIVTIKLYSVELPSEENNYQGTMTTNKEEQNNEQSASQ